jgi:hypothetical protein
MLKTAIALSLISVFALWVIVDPLEMKEPTIEQSRAEVGEFDKWAEMRASIAKRDAIANEIVYAKRAGTDTTKLYKDLDQVSKRVIQYQNYFAQKAIDVEKLNAKN